MISSSLVSASIYTLDNVRSLNFYFSGNAGFITKEKKVQIEKRITQKLEKAGFIFGETDALIFVVKVDAIGVEETQVVNIQIGLGEEVVTKRKDQIETYAYTYLDKKFIEAFDPYEDTLESLDLLVDEFIQAHKDDNE